MRILIVDDSHVARLHLELQLNAAGYRDVTSASSPAEAFRVLGIDPPRNGSVAPVVAAEALAAAPVIAPSFDLVMLDIMMPGMTGVEACRHLKTVERLRDVPVIMVTAQTETEHLAAAFAAGAMDYIVKPANEVELSARVNSALRLKEETDQRKARERDVVTQLERAEALAAELRVALAAAERQTYLQTVRALALAVEARDSYTGGHIERVRQYSLLIGERLKLSGETLHLLEFGAILHDIGKIGVPDAVLREPGPLNAEQWQAMRRHPEIGRRVLEDIGFLGPALAAVGTHHERWDGAGYPAGLAGEAIPLLGRIIAVADAYDAMTSGRPYRAALPVGRALDLLREGSGRQFEPALVEVFCAEKV